MIEVTGVRVLELYVLHVSFNDGTCRRVDLSETLWGPMFEPLRDPELFMAARFDEELGTVTWPNGADLAPEFLYEQGQVERSYAPR
jgi:hypothetical protein